MAIFQPKCFDNCQNNERGEGGEGEPCGKGDEPDEVAQEIQELKSRNTDFLCGRFEKEVR